MSIPGDIYPTFVAAAVQASPVFMDRDATVEKACDLIGEAARGGADLVVFPESFVPCFPYWPRGISLHDSDASVRAVVQMHRNAVQIPGPAVERLAAAAEAADVDVVVGVTEREGTLGYGLFNALLYLGRDGRTLGTHRKLIPTWSERCVWGRGDGSDLFVLDRGDYRMSGLICGENLMTLSKYALLAMGEQVHVAVWPSFASMSDWIQVVTRAYAIEGQVFVVSACGIQTGETVPDSFSLKDQTVWNGNGGSAIIGPDGRYVAGPVYDAETIVYGEIDLEAIVAAKTVFDGVGHYARFDVASLNLNQSHATAFGAIPTEPVGGAAHSEERWR